MKFLLILLALGGALPAVSGSSSGEFLAGFGATHDAGSVVQKLTGMMAAAKQQLGLAERRHGKVVKKVRKEAAAALEGEAIVYGNYINGYSAELTKAEANFLSVLHSARAGLAAAEAAPADPNDWKDPNTEKKAKLSAQVATADRAIKRAERRASRQAKEAEERGEEALEDEASKLGMKVGDMTPLVDKAKKTLEAVAEKKAAVPAPGDVSAQSSQNATATTKVNLTALEGDLVKATATNQAAISKANKNLDGVLSETGKEVAAKIAHLQDSLEVAQRDEISKVLGRSPDAAKKPAAKATRAKAAAVARAPAAKAAEKAKANIATKAAAIKAH